MIRDSRESAIDHIVAQTGWDRDRAEEWLVRMTFLAEEIRHSVWHGGQLDHHRPFLRTEIRAALRKYGPQVKARPGRPCTWYKDAVINETIAWLDQEGADVQPLPAIRAHIVRRAAVYDDQGGPTRNTVTDWAKEALQKYQEMRKAS
jgi:hypothetical protein